MNSDQINYLKSRGCSASNWENVEIHPESDLSLIKNVDFRGRVKIGKVENNAGPFAGISNAMIEDCTIADHPSIRNIGAMLKGLDIGSGVTIVNCGSIEMQPEASCGIGTAVAILDETGSRPVYIYPGMSAQMATLMAFNPQWTEANFLPIFEEYMANLSFLNHIADGATIINCATIKNVRIGSEIKIEGALALNNGIVVNNAPPGKCMAYVGAGVDAENFIIEDGVVASSVLLRNTYVGQGAIIEKGFTAHDSLFFANCSMENGEACAIMAAPYSVSMHKSTLLIASQSSFFNAGSGTNFSNHAYKLGPVHWGVMDRGVKTASNSYLMWGGHIGAYSLVMGNHKHHPDTSQLPFSYLFGNEDGNTIVAPGQMLKSCGLLRDAQKWPKRDRRIKHRLPLLDNITFDVLNPFTVQSMLAGIELLEKLKDQKASDDGLVHYGQFAIRPKAILSGLHLYKIAVLRYLYEKSHENNYADLVLPDNGMVPSRWIDLGAQIMPRSVLEHALVSESPDEIKNIFKEAAEKYSYMELLWAKSIAEGQFKSLMPEAPQAILELSEYLDSDRASYRNSMANETSMLGL